MKNDFYAIGLMSGTSLDGLDICYARFANENSWSFELIATQFVEYPDDFRVFLNTIETQNAREVFRFEVALTRWYAEQVNHFIQRQGIDKQQIDLLSCHGQTIFHEPSIGLTTQLCCGETLSTLTELTVVNDFRTKDVSNGGQGAPLVPIGDRLLFHPTAEAKLNLGGYANISFEREGFVHAFDICPVNSVMNKLSEKIGQPFDKGGNLAKKGIIQEELLERLESLPIYSDVDHSSWGTEKMEANYEFLFDLDDSVEDLLATFNWHAALRIRKVIDTYSLSSLFVSGGGTYNQTLLDNIQTNADCELIIPSSEIIDYKEALIFAFLGVLRLQNIPNCLSSVTGAKRDVVGGVIHYYN